MKIKDIYESTTSGSVASVAMPMGGTQKREGTLFKGKKTKKKFYESEVSEAEVNEADLILVPGQGKKLKPGFIPKDQDRRDHEVEMARSDLFHAAQNAKEIYKMIHQVSEDEGLEGWVQEKIIKANDYLNTVREYLEHKTYMQEGGVIAGGMSNFEESKERVDSLVTNALKRMEGPSINDAVKALIVEIGTQEFKNRLQFYKFYVNQMVQMYEKQGVAEGWKGELAGGTIGGIAGHVAGSAVGGPIGGIIGGAVGGTGGGIIGRELTKEEQLNELAPILAAGARLVITMAPKIAQVLKNTGKATAKAAAPVAKSGAEIAAKNADKIGVGLGAYEIGSSAADIAKAITAKVGTALEEKTIMELAQVAFKFAIPTGIVLAILYGGKKVIDSLFSNSNQQQGVAEDQVDEEKDACYSKVKSRYKVWPSAYASGALVKCRKVGASNWGNSSKK
jgi:hypothetical protein